MPAHWYDLPYSVMILLTLVIGIKFYQDLRGRK